MLDLLSNDIPYMLNWRQIWLSCRPSLGSLDEDIPTILVKLDVQGKRNVQMGYCNLPIDQEYFLHAWGKTGVSPILKAYMLKAHLLPLRPSDPQRIPRSTEWELLRNNIHSMVKLGYWNSVQLFGYSCLNAFQCPEMMSLDVFLQFQKEEKVTRTQVGRIRVLRSNRNVLTGYETDH
ncbi:hypothetical protein TNCV_2383061 [Trichonephila clavipes]|nr:hypothetical protein TNCV_2383061 [Trichonephila clavipes]